MFIEIENLSKSYGKGNSYTEVLKDINLSIEKGTISVLLGPSGAGKSTLLNIIGGIETAEQGKVLIGDKDILKLSEGKLSKYRRRNLGYIFQSYNLIPNLTVRENIEVGQYLAKDPLDIDELIETLGLTDHQNKVPSQLSGGQQQRTSIGRAVIKRPEILLCDEPTGALDYKTSKEILKLIEVINEKYGSTVVFVTHNDAIKDMADRIVYLHDGSVREDVVNEDKIPAAQVEW